MENYWSKIWSKAIDHNRAPWMKTESDKLQSLNEMEAVSVVEEDVRTITSIMKNWTSPGIDGVHNYWWKAFPRSAG